MRQIEDRFREGATEEERKDYNEGIESVLYLRCMEHRAVPALNRKEGPGECPICELKKVKEVHAREIRNMALDALSEAIVFVRQELRTAARERGVENAYNFADEYISLMKDNISAMTPEELERKLQYRTKHRQG